MKATPIQARQLKLRDTFRLNGWRYRVESIEQTPTQTKVSVSFLSFENTKRFGVIDFDNDHRIILVEK